MYDVIIIGAGCAGLAAAMYCGRYRLKTLVISKEEGGLLATAHLVENYPGFSSITGYEIMKKFKEHALKFGAEIIDGEVKRVKKKNKGFIISLKDKSYESRTLVLAMGSERRKLNIKREKELLGHGISYCASCDAAFFKDKVVGVVGGSDAAGTGALLLTDYAKKVYILYRGDKLKAEPVTMENIKKKKNKIEIIYNVNVVEAKGKDKLTSVVLDNKKEMKLDGLFIEIGEIPNAVLAKELGVKLNEEGEILVNQKSETNVKGVFAAGDVTNNYFKQAIVCASQGSIAAFSLNRYLMENS